LNRLRLEYATEIFLAEARRQFVRLRPGVDNPIRSLTDYPEDERSALMAAIGKAIASTDEMANPAYLNWSFSRTQKDQ
jgi:hypothetical protein